MRSVAPLRGRIVVADIKSVGRIDHGGRIASNWIAAHNDFHPAPSLANLMMEHFISQLGTRLVDQVNG